MIIVITGLAITSCKSNSNNVNEEYYTAQDAKKKIVNSEKEIASAQKDIYSDFQKFIKEANTKIGCIEKNISELKLKSIEEKKETNEGYLIKIEDLKKSNDVLKTELDNYVHEGNGNWQIFKADFYQNLDELEIAFNDATVKDIK